MLYKLFALFTLIGKNFLNKILLSFCRFHTLNKATKHATLISLKTFKLNDNDKLFNKERQSLIIFAIVSTVDGHH